MARLEKLDPASQTLLGKMPCPEFETYPWVEGPPLQERRVAIISTAGLHRMGDRPFTIPAGTVAKLQGDYRVIPGKDFLYPSLSCFKRASSKGFLFACSISIQL